MFDRESPEIIWVSPKDAGEEEYGTWEEPFSSLETALTHLKPGYTMVLKDGTYEGNTTFEISGSARQPIRITADDDAVVVIEHGCWFFYDTSDLIVNNLTFKDAPHGAISVIGKCNRNRFAAIKFQGCGTSAKDSCTMYFGGSGGTNNIIEDCIFEGNDKLLSTTGVNSIALMISEGDTDNGAPIRNHIVRKNQFKKYGYGILVGSSNTSENQYGHIVEYNTISNCTSEGILVKCGDTLIRGNKVENCSKNSIAIGAGSFSVIDSNRIVDCENGIRVNGAGHSVVNNCVVRTVSVAVTVCGQSGIDVPETTNLFIESNTFINCGVKKDTPGTSTPGILVEQGASCIIQKNLIYGLGNPLIVAAIQSSEVTGVSGRAVPQFVSDNNIASSSDIVHKGIESRQIDFSGTDDNFENETGFGASGWVLTPHTFDPDLDTTDEESDYIEATVIEDEDGELVIPGESESNEFLERIYGHIADGEDFTLDEDA